MGAGHASHSKRVHISFLLEGVVMADIRLAIALGLGACGDPSFTLTPRPTRIRKYQLPSIGDRFGKLTVIGFLKHPRRGIQPVVVCDCGQKTPYALQSTRLKNRKTCRGCPKLVRSLLGENHYKIWIGRWCCMLGRCNNPNHHAVLSTNSSLRKRKAEDL